MWGNSNFEDRWLRKHLKLSVQSPVWCVKIAQNIYRLADELGSELIRRKMTAAAGAPPCLSNLGQFSRLIPSFLILFIMPRRRWKMSNKLLWFFSWVTFYETRLFSTLDDTCSVSVFFKKPKHWKVIYKIRSIGIYYNSNTIYRSMGKGYFQRLSLITGFCLRIVTS